MTRVDRLYARLPVPLQHAAVSAFGYQWRWRRHGGRFGEYRAGFVERERFRPADWRDWQDARLRQMLAVAGRTPHYTAAWDALAAPVEEGEAVHALARLPITSKEAVRRRPEDFCPGGRPPSGATSVATSGTTGTPLTLYYSRDDLRRSQAARDARYHTFAGVGWHLPRATFSGRLVEPDPSSRGPFHRYNHAERQLYFSPYHLADANAGPYLDALWRHRPRWMHGYASAIHELAMLATRAGVEPPPLLGIVTIAEPLPDDARRTIERVFRCRVTEEYGLAEEVCLGLRCPLGRLHMFPDVGIVEILDERGVPCRPGMVGEIVATGLVRQTQPLIRYRTGDLAAWSAEGCPCGREMPTLEALYGRVDDVVVGTDGRRVGRLSTVPKGLGEIQAMQFVQTVPGAVSVRVVADDPIGERLRDEIERRLRDRLGAELAVDVRRVPELERTARGKVPLVFSSVSNRAGG